MRSFAERNSANAETAPPLKLPPNTFTNYAVTGNSNVSFVLLFDSLNTALRYQVYAYDQAVQFLHRLPPGTNVAIFDLSDRMTLVQGFTTDPAVLLAAMKHRRAQPKLAAMSGPEYELFRESIVTDGMRTLSRYLAGYPGRKNLIWLTVDIPGNDRAKRIRSSAPGALPDAVSNMLPFVDDFSVATGGLPLSQVAIYPVDPRALMSPAELAANPDYQAQQAAMETVAEESGGQAFYNRNDVASLLGDIVAEGSTTTA